MRVFGGGPSRWNARVGSSNCEVVSLPSASEEAASDNESNSFLIEDKHVDQPVEELKMACLCIDYLNLPAFIQPPTQDGVLKGDYVFMDYAVLNWIRHLEAGVVHADAHQQLMNQLTESLEVFIHHHWSSPTAKFAVSNGNRDRLQFFNDLPFYDKLEKTIISTRKQLSFFGQMKQGEMALNLADIVVDVRAVMESIASFTMEAPVREGLQEKYGSNLFKCCRFSCRFFTAGFSAAHERDKHIERHDRPFRCTDEACTGFLLGFTSKEERDKHMKTTHAAADIEDGNFPTDEDVRNSMAEALGEEGESSEPQGALEPPRQSPKPKRPRQTSFKCRHCPATYDRRYNLQSHLYTHTNERPYVCSVCGTSFSRRSDHKRHMSTHTGRRLYFCRGNLKNGDGWGCGRSFARTETLRRHHESKVGQRCLLPWLQEQELEGQAQISNT